MDNESTIWLNTRGIECEEKIGNGELKEMGSKKKYRPLSQSPRIESR